MADFATDLMSAIVNSATGHRDTLADSRASDGQTGDLAGACSSCGQDAPALTYDWAKGTKRCPTCVLIYG